MLPTALTYAADIQQELNEWEALTDAPARSLSKAESGRHRPVPWGDSFVPCPLVQSPDSSQVMLFDAPVTFTPRRDPGKLLQDRAYRPVSWPPRPCATPAW